MKILNNLTLKNVKLNKKRSIVTIIGIVLSTALICTVAGMFSSFRKTIVNSVILSEGDYHANIRGIKADDLKYYTNNINVDKAYIEKEIGFYNEKQYMHNEILAYSSSALDNLILSKGRLPKEQNEIIVPYSYSKYKLNEEITLDVGFFDDIEMVDLYDDDLIEKIKNFQTIKYKVVGVLNENNSTNALITRLNDTSSGFYNVKLKYNNIKNAYKYTDSIKKDYEVEYNTELLRWNLVTKNDAAMKTIYSIIGIVLGIIVVTSVFVIRNSFEISITEKMKQFGMLSSIGATKRQIRNSVLFEGFILGIIGIPIGILLGYGVIHILIIFTNTLLGGLTSSTDKFIVDIPISALLTSIILGSITIFFSSLKSSIKASRISPIVAIRANNDIKIKKKKLKTPKIISKIFGIGGVISYKNLKRNKKKYRTTVISLVVSISIFIALSFFTNSLFKVSNLFYQKNYYNMVFNLITENYQDEINVYNKIVALEDNEYSIIRTKSINLDYKNSEHNIILYSIGTEAYKKYIKKLGLNYNDSKDKIIYVENTTYKDAKTKKIIKTYDFKTNDVLKMYNDKEYNLKVAKITKDNSYDIYTYVYEDGLFLISDELMDKIDGYLSVQSLKIKSSSADDFEEYVNNMKIDDLQILNYDKEAEAMNKMVLWISVFLYGFIIVITLIGVTNIFNTITTSMSLRSKEFAMLKSVGMTNKEFNRMIRLESILYGLKSLVIGSIIGTGLSYFMYKSLSKSIDYGFDLPVVALAISTIFIFLVVGITMKYSLNKINKQNIIETIRRDNI